MKKWSGSIAFLFAITCVHSALGSIISTSGQVVSISPPASVAKNALQSNTTDVVFQEQNGLALASPLAVNATKPGTYTSVASLTPGVIAAGTVIQDYFLHSDPIDNSGLNFIGSITFDSNILGVIALSGDLSSTDSTLGHAGTAYPTGDAGRGYELTGSTQDQFTISPDMRTLSFNVHTYTDLDQLRVITSVPEPASVGLLGAALFCFALFARKFAWRCPPAESAITRRSL